MFSKLDFDLVEAIRTYITQSKSSDRWPIIGPCKLILFLVLPKSRTPGGTAEDSEEWAFLVATSVQDLAEKLGIYQSTEGLGLGRLLIPVEPYDLDKVETFPLKPTYRLFRELAQELSGIEVGLQKITVIGAGALGSQVVLNLARQGIGQWTITDDDVLLPHNLARHALSPYFEGRKKAEAL
ncbi:MAG: ThiF family adenylyltransferase, partial [Chloroflexi bacterium]|nr:ThiF family adenylyltransferase [Chloroflexota bacterium]